MTPQATTTPQAAPGGADRTHIRLLGRLLGEVIREQHGQQDYQRVETIRRQTVGEYRAGGRGLEMLADLSQADTLLLIRAFSIFSQLANIADDHVLRGQMVTPEANTVAAQAGLNALSREAVAAFLKDALFVPVLTAHPTEVRRKSVLDRETELGTLLELREHAAPDTAQQTAIDARLKCAIRILWQTRMLRASRIQVTDEIENNIAVFARTFVPQIPAVKRHFNSLFGLDGAIIPYLKPGSWVGGDRDGHPDISPETLDYAVRRQAETVLDHYLDALHTLGTELSLSDSLVSTTEALKALAASPEHSSPHQMDEPYRRALVTCYARMAATRTELTGRAPMRPPRFNAPRYATPEDFAADLATIADSLAAGGDRDLADGRLRDLREQVAAFGFHLAVMDVRQNADVHERAVAELLKESDAGDSYLKLDEDARSRLLERELSHARPLRSFYVTYSPETARELAIADKVAALKADFGQSTVAQYVISKANSVSDLLEVALLMKETGLFVPGPSPQARLRIVPLFETIEDLRRSADVMDAFFTCPLARAMLAGQDNLQEIMVGYSDSNKDGGYVTSNWELRTAISRLVALGKARGIRMRFFHGRGGAVGRGGGSSFDAIRALPTGASASGTRITEQGEVVSSKYGDPVLGQASLETAVAAAMLAELAPRDDAADSDAGKTVLAGLSQAAFAHYQALVYGTPNFEIYFRQATPLLEIADLKIGSRPASRSASPRIEDLRAIPWVFSWSQARVMLPGWYGFGTAANKTGTGTLKQLYSGSAFFRTMLANMEMVLAKSSLDIARRYADLVEDRTLADLVFARITAEWHLTHDALLTITGQKYLLENEPRLAESINSRLPYVNALNHLQVSLMARRRAGDSDELTPKGIRMTINGIAAGLRNSG